MTNDKPDFKEAAESVLKTIRLMDDDKAIGQLILYAANNWMAGYTAGGDRAMELFKEQLANDDR